MGAGTETRAVTELGTGTRVGTGTGTRPGSGRVKKSRRSPINRTRVVDAMWEPGETLVERKKYVDKKGFIQ